LYYIDRKYNLRVSAGVFQLTVQASGDLLAVAERGA
jgi:hypothetical protein